MINKAVNNANFPAPKGMMKAMPKIMVAKSNTMPKLGTKTTIPKGAGNLEVAKLIAKLESNHISLATGGHSVNTNIKFNT